MPDPALADHAAAAGRLDTLLHDLDYLVHATPHLLRHALAYTRTPAGTLLADIYRASADVHATAGPNARRDILAIDAARYQQPAIAHALSRARPWQPRWATGALVHPALRTTITTPKKPIAIAMGVVDGHPVAVTCGYEDRVVRVWDLTTGTEHAVLTGHTHWVTAVAVGALDGRPVAVTVGEDPTPGAIGGDDRTVRVWDLATGTEHAALGNRTERMNVVAVAEVDGRPVALTGGSPSSAVRVWDLTTPQSQFSALTGDFSEVTAVAVGEVDGRPVAVTAHHHIMVLVWDLATGTELATLTHPRMVTAMAVGALDGRPVAVIGTEDRMVRVWDLATGTQHATFRTNRVDTVAVAEVDGRPVAVTGGDDDGTVRVWDLATGTEHAVLTGHTKRVVAVGALDGRPVAVTGGEDCTVRVWD
ncbi:WD40 repeat domain-containing protein, partial [Streptomyces sp. NPDC057557]|uniref:WD40 repeat domain-containing protein n=1 Tax=Streptomyces sp. NPDC057557 TaxID=3346167 RepID=UPI0036ACBB15